MPNKTIEPKDSEYYVVRTYHKTADAITSKVKSNLQTFNQNYIEKTLETGKEIVDGIGQDTRKFISKIKKQPSKKNKPNYYIVRTIDQTGDRVSKRIKKSYKEIDDRYIQKSVELGKEIVEGIETDTRKLLKHIAKSHKAFRRTISLNAFEKRLSKNLNALRRKINLPGKDDMEKLTKTMDVLNSKVDALTKQYST